MMLSSSLFDGLNTFHGFSLRGDENLSFQEMKETSGTISSFYNVEESAWVTQVHGDNVLEVEKGGGCGIGDAIMTSKRGLALVIRTADCVPVLLSNGSQVAAIHAGWRGLKANIIGKTVSKLRSGGAPWRAVVGPCICHQCYEVGEEVVNELLPINFEPAMWVDRSREKPHVNLKEIARLQLQRAGLAMITVMSECTLCDTRFHSYRRNGKKAGRMASVIGLR